MQSTLAASAFLPPVKFLSGSNKGMCVQLVTETVQKVVKQ